MIGHDQVRLRLRRGQQGPEGPARRQGRQPRRDDQPRAAGAAGLHDQHRRVPGLPRARAASRTGSPTRSSEHLAALEKEMGRALGQPDGPLLVSVRSGAKFSMPGMMETVLNVGLNDESVHGPGRDGRRRRAVRLRLLPPAAADVRQHRARHRGAVLRRRARPAQGRRGAPTNDLDLDVDDLPALVATYKELIEEQHRPGRSRRTRASSWTWPCARSSTPGTPSGRCSTAARSGSPSDLGTAVNIAVDGLRQRRRRLRAPASPSPATRRPATQGVYGDYLQNAQGEDVVAGIRNTVPLADLEQHRQGRRTTSCSASWRRSRTTTATCATSSSPSSTASSGCCRPGSASGPPEAAFRIAVQLVDQGLIDLDEALRRVTGAQLAQLMFPRFDATADRELIAQGHERLAGCRGRQGGLRLGDRGRVGRARRGRDPGPPGDQPRRPARDDGGPRHPDQPGRQDLARRGGGPRHGPHLRVRRRRRSTWTPARGSSRSRGRTDGRARAT